MNQTNDIEIFGTTENRLTGFCLWISVPAFEKLGFLDDGFVATFEDDDYTVRARLAGLPVEKYNINVHHYIKDRPKDIVATTTGAYDALRMYISSARFRLKWSVPPEVKHREEMPEGEYGPARKGFAEWVIDNHVWDDEMKVEAIWKQKSVSA